MRISEHVMRQWVANASLPQERLSRDFSLVEGGESDVDLLEKWRHNLGGGDEAAFTRGLAWQGISLAHASTLLRPVRLRPDAALPFWAITIREVLEAADFSGRMRSLDLAPAPDLIPFQDIWLPLVEAAAVKLVGACEGNPYATPSVVTALKFDLLSMIGSVSARTLYSSFSEFRAEARMGMSGSPFSNECLVEFKKRLFESTFQPLFSEFPVLVRFLGTILGQWLTLSQEFLERLQSDAGELTTFCGEPLNPHSVRIRTGLSDRHHGGRRCIAVQLSAQHSVIYKPRVLSPEKFFGELLSRFGAPALTPLRSPRLLTRAEYGWEESITGKSCSTEEEIESYYRRAGAILCLTYLTGGVDFHAENVIADGVDPIIIDLEGLFSHFAFERPSFEEIHLSSAARACFVESVLRTALLPLRMEIGDALVDVAGFPAEYSGDYFETRTRWRNGTTDAIAPHRQLVRVGSPRNRVSLDGEILMTPSEYCDAIKEGFSLQYDHIREPKRTQELLRWFVDQPEVHSRFIFRDTAFYAALNERLLSAPTMRSGAELGVLLDSLGRAQTLAFKGENPDWQIVESEKRQILALDVPKFTTTNKGRDLSDDTGVCIHEAFDQSAAQQFLSRVSNLSEADRDRQLRIIEVSFRGTSTVVQKCQSVEETASPSELKREDFLRVAQRVGYILNASVVQDDLRRANWLGTVTDKQNRKLSIQPLCLDLYEGVLGPALFYAALSRVAGDGDSCSMSQRILCAARTLVENDLSFRSLLRDGIGAFRGIGSLIYTLNCCGTILSQQSYVDAAVSLLGRISPSQIREYEQFDILSGISGFALVVEGLARVQSRSSVEAHLLACRDSLLALTSSQWGSSLSGEIVSQSGFAHGASGVALAALRVGRLLEEEELVVRADTIIRWVDTLYSEAQGGWAVGVEEKPRYFERWCNGSAGISVSRAAFPRLPASKVPRVALNTEGSESDWSVCCGTAGIGEICVTLGARMNAPEVRAHGMKLLAHSYQHAGIATSDEPLRRFHEVGFFQGISGLGYSALRQVESDLPWILGVE